MKTHQYTLKNKNGYGYRLSFHNSGKLALKELRAAKEKLKEEFLKLRLSFYGSSSENSALKNAGHIFFTELLNFYFPKANIKKMSRTELESLDLNSLIDSLENLKQINKLFKVVKSVNNYIKNPTYTTQEQFETAVFPSTGKYEDHGALIGGAAFVIMGIVTMAALMVPAIVCAGPIGGVLAVSAGIALMLCGAEMIQSCAEINGPQTQNLINIVNDGVKDKDSANTPKF